MKKRNKAAKKLFKSMSLISSMPSWDVEETVSAFRQRSDRAGWGGGVVSTLETFLWSFRRALVEQPTVGSEAKSTPVKGTP